MKRVSMLVLVLALMLGNAGCGGAAPRRMEGPVTTSWTHEDDQALGLAPATPPPEGTSPDARAPEATSGGAAPSPR